MTDSFGPGLGITSERRVDRAVRGGLEAARVGEAGFAALFDESPAAAFILREGSVLAVNQKALALFGYESADLIVGGAFLDLLAEPERSAFESRTSLAPVADAGPSSYDTIGRRRDGSEFPMETLIGTIAPSDGPAVLIYLADLTERRGNEARHERQDAQLRQSAKMEAVGQLAGGIAHDFNNLMTIVRGYTDLMLESPDLVSAIRDDLVAVRDAAERASVLTRQLLAFSRQQVLQPRLVSINDVLAPIVPMLRRLLGEEIEFEYLPGDALGAVRVDPSQLEQVVMNLAINARDAMPSGGRLTLETTEVTLDGSYVDTHPEATSGRHVVLAVSDTGTGMEEGVRARIFEPFFTTKAVGKGTGLGLATVYGIVNQSGGHLAVYSEPGHGSVFKVYLPGVDTGGVPEASAGDADPGATPERPIARTILLVEDEPSVRAFMKTVLTRQGYRVLDAGSPQKALDLIRHDVQPIDLVVTDVVMPGMTGPELVKRLLALRPELRVVYASGYTERAVKGNDLIAGGATFLAKPFTPAELVRVVGQALARAGNA